MKKANVIIITLFLFASSSYGQRLYGTAIAAMKCSDGILIAIDSRMTIGATFDSGQYADVAYIEGIPKITFINNFPVAFQGSLIFGNSYLFKITSDFNKLLDANKNVIDVNIAFKDYIKSLNIMTGQKIISGGYKDGKPFLFYFNGGSDTLAVDTASVGWVVTGNAYKQMQKYPNKLYTCNAGKLILNAVINNTAKSDKLVGGPVSIIKINKDNSTEWMQNGFTKNFYTDFTDFIDWIIKNKIMLVPLVKDGVQYAIKALRLPPYRSKQ